MVSQGLFAGSLWGELRCPVEYELDSTTTAVFPTALDDRAVLGLLLQVVECYGCCCPDAHQWS